MSFNLFCWFIIDWAVSEVPKLLNWEEGLIAYLTVYLLLGLFPILRIWLYASTEYPGGLSGINFGFFISFLPKGGYGLSFPK